MDNTRVSQLQERAKTVVKWGWPAWGAASAFFLMGALAYYNVSVSAFALIFASAAAFPVGLFFLAVFIASSYLILDSVPKIRDENAVINKALISIDITELPEGLNSVTPLVIRRLNNDRSVIASPADGPQNIYAQVCEINRDSAERQRRP